MDLDPTTPTRLSLKRPLDTHSGQTPAPKRQQKVLPVQETPESEDDDTQRSPIVAATARKKKAGKHNPRNTPDPAPSRPPPLRLPSATATDETKSPSPLPMAFAPTTPTQMLPSEAPSSPAAEMVEPNSTLSAEDLDNALAGYRQEWSLDPAIEIFDMAKIIDTAQDTKMRAKAPAQIPVKQDWHLIPPNPTCPDFNHESDNPFDFLPITKLDKLIRFWKGEKEAADNLTRVEKEFMGEPRIEKVLAKVVNVGLPAMTMDRKCAWIRSAITSAITQSGIETNDFDKLKIAINPAKQSYSWIVIPVRHPVFKILQNVRAALDPRSGTLVILRTWKEQSFPTQRFYAFGIHRPNDDVPLELAISDYRAQMQETLETNNVTIISMLPSKHGDTQKYAIEIKFGFAEGTTPFLINSKKLADEFWTGLGNIKTKRAIEYKWPAKCRYCESESHITGGCPWRDIEIAGRTPNVYNCRYHNPGWTEPTKRPKIPIPAPTTELLDMRPPHERSEKSKKSKGKEREMVIDTPEPQPGPSSLAS